MLSRSGPARCRGRSAASCSRRWRDSAGTGLPASACCSTASPTAGRRRRPSSSRPRAWITSLVSYPPAPARIGTRPSASSTRISTIRSRSASVSVGLSPVVPTGTRKWMPASICRRPSRRTAASSRLPLARERSDERRAAPGEWCPHAASLLEPRWQMQRTKHGGLEEYRAFVLACPGAASRP